MKTYSAIVIQGEMKMQSEYTRQAFKKFLAKNEGARIEFVPVVPESKKQRNMLHGAFLSLWAYLDGKDHKDKDTLEALFEISKTEFNGDIMVVAGQTRRYGKSTKGKLNDGYMTRFLDFLIEQYGIEPEKVLNPKTYKKWRDEIYPFGGPDNFVDYMVEIGLLK